MCQIGTQTYRTWTELIVAKVFQTYLSLLSNGRGFLKRMKIQSKLNWSWAHQRFQKSTKLEIFSRSNQQDAKLDQSEMRKSSIPLRRFIKPPGVPQLGDEFRINICTCAKLQQCICKVSRWFILRSGGTLPLYEAHCGWVLNLQCTHFSLMPSIFTSFGKTLKSIWFEGRHRKQS
jgi:hypothetical protein